MLASEPKLAPSAKPASWMTSVAFASPARHRSFTSQTWKDSVHEGYASQALDPLQDTPILIGSLEGDAPLIGAAEHLLASLK